MANNIEKQLKEISERLEQGVKEIFTSERYTEYLNTMSKFHNYSFNNTLLITMQKPEATLVAGYGKMLILTFEDSEEEILNHIISCVNTGARAFQVIENAKTNLSYGDIVILLDKRELFRKQEKIDLSFIEFEILHLLMRSPGRVFSKEQIYDIIWNEPYSGDYNVVMRHICNIREKIEDDPGHPVYIQTVRGVGYRFNGNLGSE